MTEMTRTTMRLCSRPRWSAVIALLVCLAPARAVLAQDRDRPEPAAHIEHLHEVLGMLEQGIAALGELDRHELRDRLHEVAEDLRREIEHAHRDRERHQQDDEDRPERRSERQVVEHRLELLRLALKAMAEADRRDEVRMLELAIHAYELMKAGRGDEARQARRAAPPWEAEIELLGLAARLYERFEMPDRAEMILRGRDELWRGWRERRARDGDVDRERERAREGTGNREQAVARRRLEMMHMALPALLEAGRHETAELLERAIRALEVNLERREDRQAREIREQSPDLGQQIEILRYAAELWEEFGHETKAAALGKYAEDMLAAYRQRQERRARQDRQPPDRPERAERQRERERSRAERRRPTDREAAIMEQMEELQRRMAELERMIRELRGRDR
jgi:hypothetical protein